MPRRCGRRDRRARRRLKPPPDSIARMLSVGLFSLRSRRCSGRSGLRDDELLLQRRFDVRHLLDGRQFGRRQRRHVVVEARDRDAARVVLHAREEARQAHRRIGRPVAVVAAVQIAARAEHGDGEAGAAAHAVIHRRPPARMARAIQRDREVGLQRVGTRVAQSGGSCASRLPPRRRARRGGSRSVRRRWPSALPPRSAPRRWGLCRRRRSGRRGASRDRRCCVGVSGTSPVGP